MSPTFLAILGAAFLMIWTLGAYSFWRISQKNKAKASTQVVPPVYRLAEQWLAESQKKIEELIQRAEQPLSTAQNELLELRLEASRLPQGVKNLKLVRESLAGPLKPAAIQKNLADIARLYLDEGDFRTGGEGIVFFKCPLGEVPCMEVEGGDHPLSEAQMKALLPQVNRILADADKNHVGGGLLYFGSDRDYQACLANVSWMEGLKSRNLMVMDFKGLTALLVSLRLSKDVDRVIRVFDQGVQSTVALTGQADQMSGVLSSLGAHSLKIRTILEGTVPNDLKDSP